MAEQSKHPIINAISCIIVLFVLLVLLLKFISIFAPDIFVWMGELDRFFSSLADKVKGLIYFIE